MSELILDPNLVLHSNGASWGSKTNLPKGSILQMVYTSTTTEHNVTSSTYASWSGLATNITPISSTSHLWIWVNAVRLNVQDNGNEGNVKITDGTNETIAYRMHNFDSDDNYQSFNPCLNWYWPQTHTAGAQITLNVQTRSVDNSHTFGYGDSGTSSYLIVQEIAQ